ncbi:hypothetical protein LCGC14_1025040 [marine sediment metagenome]|uniref:Uncharacterized protein n=1 Tax=marine sediment metagenome TaxID=412755 RepID=A0A0F9N0U8_9ZZZZ
MDSKVIRRNRDEITIEINGKEYTYSLVKEEDKLTPVVFTEILIMEGLLSNETPRATQEDISVYKQTGAVSVLVLRDRVIKAIQFHPKLKKFLRHRSDFVDSYNRQIKHLVRDKMLVAARIQHRDYVSRPEKGLTHEQ